MISVATISIEYSAQLEVSTNEKQKARNLLTSIRFKLINEMCDLYERIYTRINRTSSKPDRYGNVQVTSQADHLLEEAHATTGEVTKLGRLLKAMALFYINELSTSNPRFDSKVAFIHDCNKEFDMVFNEFGERQR